MQPLDPFRAPLTGVNIIEASAGTGKTYTIAILFLRLLLEKGLSVNRILVVTYTVAATAELRDRIRRRIREALDAFEKGASDDEALRRLLSEYQDRETAVSRLGEALAGF
ncbi:MAG: UvrD-helicase domain-containing protein, partial [Desulfobulbaceae bacterium]|nr:UvrD-helicase domain-containing protein [Desulfobulbaceae bacterium]